MNNNVRIEDFDTSLFQSEKLKVIEFKKNGNETTCKYHDLYSCSQLDGSDDLKGLYFEIEKDDAYVYGMNIYHDYGFILNKVIRVNYDRDIQCVLDRLHSFIKSEVCGYDGFKRHLETCKGIGTYINVLDIEVLRMGGDLELVKEYIQYRNDYRIRQAQEEEKRLLLQKQQEEQEEQEHIKRINNKLEEIEQKIKEGVKVENEDIKLVTGTITSPFLLLFNKYDIKVPFKTQGWVKNALDHIYQKEDGTWSYFYCLPSANSTVFAKYLNILTSKITAA